MRDAVFAKVLISFPKTRRAEIDKCENVYRKNHYLAFPFTRSHFVFQMPVQERGREGTA